MSRVINSILDNYKLEKKEVLEVCQIGKFVEVIDAEIQIVDKPKPPSPDFIISYNGQIIGLEHTQIYSADRSRYLKIKTLLNNAEKKFREKYQDENLIASISVKNDEFDYKQKDKPKLTENIADYVYWTKNRIEFKLPNFITEITTTKHDQVSFWFDEKNWNNAEYLTRERLHAEILKKEPKIQEYRNSKQNLSEYWLVLMIGSLSSVSYKLNESENYKMDSAFNRVYLMTDFDAKIIRIK
ncbi:hypothetical protein [Cellulophaga baltica]|uniref:Uncharacterized protein n=1 Tax=Cellulophaga baltica TaxID=76594 RepID=A0A1G7M3A3_9FLAO|nr:hypothetical protein [Cellulophaga baltica]SDF56308.1 hypothetical protein SAMN04487992_1293 [Cellulophaga baltica]